MKIPVIDEPVRLGRAFWVTYGVMLIPSLWLLKPWSWKLPLFSKVAGAVLPPFLAAIAICSFVLLTFSVTAHFHGRKREFAGIVAAILGSTIFLVVAWMFSGYKNLPAICAFVASCIGYSLFYSVHRKEPGNPTGPTLPARRGSC
ncbi:MAG: hypothetical protein HS122_17085 [Opitutaceae bacterium]|nr:hypothetical protein [Opitutaceae bacterium]